MKKFMPIVYLVVVAVIVWVLMATGVFAKKDSTLSGYQAVFLTNGQVYFGKVSGVGSQFSTLKDIYYLRQTQVQPADAGAQANQQIQLIKLGTEIHAPADLMKINRDQILFVENLKTDGQVAKAIQKYKDTGGASATATPAPSATK